MALDFAFDITTTRFDEDYSPSDGSRLTTNFANLARGEQRQQNLRNALTMIDNRFNDLAHWDNPDRDRYALELDIVTVLLRLPGAGDGFPLIEMLDLHAVDRRTGERSHGIVGNNFSSYVRDYDFNVVLPEHRASGSELPVPDDFGDLHGNLFRHFLDSDTYARRFRKAPVICISVSSSQTYRRTENRHPILGVEYLQDGPSMTDEYFARMGLRVRCFMPPGSVAPLAFYFQGDLLGDYTNLELIGTISTMETFQKIYRPEIYNANSTAAHLYRPSLENRDYSQTRVTYDREERKQLGLEQGRFAAEHLIRPYGQLLEEWASDVEPQAARDAEHLAA